MKYEKWHILQNLLSSQGFNFTSDSISLNGNQIVDYSEFRSLIVQTRDAFIEECRENLINEENKQLVIQTYIDLREKLNYILWEFFSNLRQEDVNNIIYKPLEIDIYQKTDDLMVLCPRLLYETIGNTQRYLQAKIEREEADDIVRSKATTRKYNSSYLSLGFQLHPRIKSVDGYAAKLQHAYYTLKDENLIEDGFLREFLTLFEGTLPSQKIRWNGNLNFLKYFILKLAENEIIENPQRRLYTIAEEAFISSNGSEITPGTLSGRSNPIFTRSIDVILAEIQGS